MGWWHGILADVEGGRSRPGTNSIGIWPARRRTDANPARPHADWLAFQAKLDQRIPYVNDSAALLNGLVYDGPGSPVLGWQSRCAYYEMHQLRGAGRVRRGTTFDLLPA